MQMPKGISRQDLRAWFSAFELWFTKASRIAVVMGRGAYWLGERKRLMTLLGMQTFDQIEKNQVDHKALEPLVTQLKKINERLEAEERLVQQIRSSQDADVGDDDEERLDQ